MPQAAVHTGPERRRVDDLNDRICDTMTLTGTLTSQQLFDLAKPYYDLNPSKSELSQWARARIANLRRKRKVWPTAHMVYGTGTIKTEGHPRDAGAVTAVSSRGSRAGGQAGAFNQVVHNTAGRAINLWLLKANRHPQTRLPIPAPLPEFHWSESLPLTGVHTAIITNPTRPTPNNSILTRIRQKEAANKAREAETKRTSCETWPTNDSKRPHTVMPEAAGSSTDHVAATGVHHSPHTISAPSNAAQGTVTPHILMNDTTIAETKSNDEPVARQCMNDGSNTGSQRDVMQLIN